MEIHLDHIIGPLKLFRFGQNLPNILTVDTCAEHSFENGEVNYDKQPVNDGRYPIDTVATYTCNIELVRSGSSSRTCQNSGNWEPALPICYQGNKKIILQLNIAID